MLIDVLLMAVNIGLFYNAGRSEGDPLTTTTIGTIATVVWAFQLGSLVGLLLADAVGFGLIAGIRILREKWEH
jgi:hypothetical protein